MVDGVSDEERERFAVKLKVGFVLLIGVSAGLITLQGDVGIEVTLAAVAVGLLIGGSLVWWVFPERTDLMRGGRSGRRRR